MDTNRTEFRRKLVTSIVFTVVVLLMLGVFPVMNVFAQETGQSAPMTAEEAGVAKWALIAAAAAFGFGALGAGIGIANVGAAAMGAISEKPEVGGRALIFIALAEGLVVFGFITALIILGQAG
jgi:V/A-type H+-transporting ATPase subunit K